MSPAPAASPNKMWTKILLMAGTVIFAFLPLYLTSSRDAFFDGAWLILAIAFSSDAIFRCADPANRKGNWTVFFLVGSVALLGLSLLQYGPIANDLRREKIALQKSLNDKTIAVVAAFEEERKEDQESLPNSSRLLLFASIVAEFSVIVLVES